MCGLAGMVVRDGIADADRDEVAALTDLVARRGPDDAGTWDDGREAVLGFRRLAIIDLSSRGHQPMVTDDGAHALVLNGEIYNFRELRRRLEAEGRTFRSTSDTEVALVALAHWGEDALARFEGMFALAWYRPRERRLVLARDTIGIKPLHWWHDGAVTVFGSQYDQVVRHRRCDRGRVDRRALELYLRLGVLPAPHGLIEGTGQVLPGHLVDVGGDGRMATRPFRTIPDPPARADRLRGDDAVEAVTAAVASSVRRQMVSDVPVGVFLSGGVDSPLVAAHAADHSTERLRAFSIGTDDRVLDESVAAAAYAEALDLDHTLRRIDAPSALGMVEQVTAACTEPLGDSSILPTLLVSSLAAESVKTVLSGDGGDELLWGYPRFAKVRAARRWFDRTRAARVLAYAATKPAPTHRRPPRGVLFPTIGDWYLDAHSGLRDSDLDVIAPGLPGMPEDMTLFGLDGPVDDDGLMQWMRANELACHLPMVLQKVDRASMHHSLEVRVPLLDLEVVETAVRVDPDSALRGTLGKVPLRRALAERVDPTLIPVAKKGFSVPLRDWLRGDLEPWARDLLGGDLFPSGAFASAAVSVWYDDHVDGHLDRTRGLWNLLSLQAWARTHLVPLPRGGSA